MPLHFKQSCPVCGRRLEVPARLLGQTIGCQHCTAEFRAGENQEESNSAADAGDALLARVEAILARSTRQTLRSTLGVGTALCLMPTMGPTQ